MTVGELIAKLQEYDRELPVEVFDTCFGYDSIETVAPSIGQSESGAYRKVNII